MNYMDCNNDLNSSIIGSAAISGAASGIGAAAIAGRDLHIVNNAIKAMGTKDTFNKSKDMLTKVATQHATKQDIYSVKGLKNFVFNINKGTKPTFEAISEGLINRKECIKKGMPKHILKWTAIGAAAGAAFGLLNKITNKIASDKEF